MRAPSVTLTETLTRAVRVSRVGLFVFPVALLKILLGALRLFATSYLMGRRLSIPAVSTAFIMSEAPSRAVAVTPAEAGLTKASLLPLFSTLNVDPQSAVSATPEERFFTASMSNLASIRGSRVTGVSGSGPLRTKRQSRRAWPGKEDTFPPANFGSNGGGHAYVS
ncbi:MAG: hypothetical protein V2G44_04665 [bacterium JZ-2024 1]